MVYRSAHTLSEFTIYKFTLWASYTLLTRNKLTYYGVLYWVSDTSATSNKLINYRVTHISYISRYTTKHNVSISSIFFLNRQLRRDMPSRYLTGSAAALSQVSDESLSVERLSGRCVRTNTSILLRFSVRVIRSDLLKRDCLTFLGSF
jgi:hypothetical protein